MDKDSLEIDHTNKDTHKQYNTSGLQYLKKR